MADVLSRMMADVLGGGMGDRGLGGDPPRHEAGRRGGHRMAPMQEQPGPMGSLTQGGGLGAVLGRLLGGAGTDPAGSQTGGVGPVGGGVRGIALMALLATLMRGRGGALGLSNLARGLRDAGLGSQVDSWIARGPNQALRPEELARAIPPEALDDIEGHTGLARDAVLSALSRGLPALMDRLTPAGRLPMRDAELDDQDEAALRTQLGLGPSHRA